MYLVSVFHVASGNELMRTRLSFGDYYEAEDYYKMLFNRFYYEIGEYEIRLIEVQDGFETILKVSSDDAV